MEALRTEFRRGDYTQRLVKRNKYAAIYETLLEHEIIGYEVFLIRKQKRRTVRLAGVEIEYKAKEMYPSNEQFGYNAYAPQTLEKAESYFAILTMKGEAVEMKVSLN